MKKSKIKEFTWREYEKIANGDYTDIVIDQWSLMSLLRKKKTSIRLPKYQISFLEQKHPTGRLSEALRAALDDLIRLESNKSNKNQR
ncbi:MAG: hypothetical protein ACFE9L_03345 [Candidatus Hodarchaeota archaeon]